MKEQKTCFKALDITVIQGNEQESCAWYWDLLNELHGVVPAATWEEQK